LLFGLKEDIIKFYNIPFILNNKSNEHYNNILKIKEIGPVERYIASAYINIQLNKKLITCDDINKYFIQDNSMVLFWYTRNKYL
jgi:hypothetical protein